MEKRVVYTTVAFAKNILQPFLFKQATKFDPLESNLLKVLSDKENVVALQKDLVNFYFKLAEQTKEEDKIFEKTILNLFKHLQEACAIYKKAGEACGIDHIKLTERLIKIFNNEELLTKIYETAHDEKKELAKLILEIFRDNTKLGKPFISKLNFEIDTLLFDALIKTVSYDDIHDTLMSNVLWNHLDKEKSIFSLSDKNIMDDLKQSFLTQHPVPVEGNDNIKYISLFFDQLQTVCDLYKKTADDHNIPRADLNPRLIKILNNNKIREEIWREVKKHGKNSSTQILETFQKHKLGKSISKEFDTIINRLLFSKKIETLDTEWNKYTDKEKNKLGVTKEMIDHVIVHLNELKKLLDSGKEINAKNEKYTLTKKYLAVLKKQGPKITNRDVHKTYREFKQPFDKIIKDINTVVVGKRRLPLPSWGRKKPPGEKNYKLKL